MRAREVLAVLAFLSIATPAAAALVVDEATYPGAGGDYNNLLNPPLPEAVVFDLEGGSNAFSGRIVTPGDSGDTFLVALDAAATLTRIRVQFATNAQDLNPVAINQNTRLVFDLASSSEPQPLVQLALTGRPDGPVTFESALLALMGGLYNTTMLTEVLALNSGGAVGYTVYFDVTAPPIPEPSTWALMLGGLGVLGWLSRRRRAE